MLTVGGILAGLFALPNEVAKMLPTVSMTFFLLLREASVVIHLLNNSLLA
jgi:hypothetical protein